MTEQAEGGRSVRGMLAGDRRLTTTLPGAILLASAPVAREGVMHRVNLPQCHAKFAIKRRAAPDRPPSQRAYSHPLAFAQ
jgi:hypothetical protein